MDKLLFFILGVILVPVAVCVAIIIYEVKHRINKKLYKFF